MPTPCSIDSNLSENYKKWIKVEKPWGNKFNVKQCAGHAP